MEYISRIVDDVIDRKTEAFNAVSITGPKGCGKTRTARERCKTVIEFQDEDKREGYLAVAETAPKLFLKNPKKANMYSMIEADYLMENNVESRNLFLFLSNDEGDNYFCRSFFPEEKMDYSKNQASWTLLYKKKIDLSTGIETVLYDRIK